MKTNLVTLTIGQSPRIDILPMLLTYLPEAQIAHAGLLDGLSRQQIEQEFGKQDGDRTLVSRLNDGSQVLLASHKVERGLQKCILQLEEQGFETILLLCTGVFDRLHTNRAMLLKPDRIVPPLIATIVGDLQVGVVVPVVEQTAEQASKWKVLSHPPCYAVASPYQAGDGSLLDAALSLQEQGAEVVVLDCIGYQQRHRDRLQKILGIPVLLPNTLVVKLAAEVLVQVR
ncbi:AroM family protein [Erwinia tasmaniensis]|uniref:Protein of aro operon, regulated by aroR n=1 Tax=Erwinia tasmaniensis (strain DSM 17950 / CFBP 7177 / CIP 109463 / NCPPB 4357 / Et1/99) TaxID=465817 RepID=B2VIS4_ERWT9|nr:AroM family protein [Erwinia tasmaniensis]CAO97603.1 Protein of aro operon, regulated by aroR [Erwinia tasmaniensis Et1/99]